MFNPLNLFSKLIKSGNQKELNRIQKIVENINALEKEIETLKDDEFPKKSNELIEELNKGKKRNEFVP